MHIKWAKIESVSPDSWTRLHSREQRLQSLPCWVCIIKKSGLSLHQSADMTFSADSETSVVYYETTDAVLSAKGV